ncbi:MAKKKK cascade protein kinase regulator Ste50, partial [Pseudohyphozyma bogoriensis]
HGITGEILIHLDHEALKDVGIHSVGQRLAILRAVYAAKVAQNIPVEEGHYVPPSDDLENGFDENGDYHGAGASGSSQHMLGLLYERDDRIRNLEIEVQRLHESLLTLRDDFASSSRPTTATKVAPPVAPKEKEKDKHERSEREKDKDNPYRSFRVTLEDPCYKVLPAALKKYKINDDWKQYALFICYGNTERCLAYDEKPLLLFQRLKESNANPVFMLRHMKDIKSPITVASAKHALRRDKRDAKAGVGLDKPPAMDRNGQAMTIRNTRLHYPPVLLPVGKDKEKEGGEDVDEGKPPPSPREAPGYCISIYPYLAEREDEFDVAVGDTFVIISKTKGWWVVHRDLGPSSSSSSDARKSAWVPAGCLLETSVPPLSLPGASSGTYNASTVPIEPGYVVSVSTPGVALMDYAKMGSDELEVRKGQMLRILKRYNHWSYAIKEDGQRGWIPSWFCGRASRDGQPPTPTLGSSTTSTTTTSGATVTRNGTLNSSGGNSSRPIGGGAGVTLAVNDDEATLVD